LRFCDFQSIRVYGTAAPGKSEAQAAHLVFAAQKGIAAKCGSATGANKATPAEKRSIGVTIH
jgi:hypothetical protein